MTTHESQGSEFRVLNSASPALYVAVGQITSINGLRGGTATVINVSHLASTRQEKRMGLPDDGQLQITVMYDPADAQMSQLEAARSARSVISGQIALSNSPETTFTGTGFVLSIDTPIDFDDVVRCTFVIETATEWVKA